MEQPKLFEGKRAADATERERLVLYALGEFQARGLALAGRELPLDRLRGALRRASEDLGIEELNDEASVEAFEAMGARVRRVPTFVAKHPFRVTISDDLSARARAFYEEQAAPSDDEATS
jgi:anti-sigma factor RsiW